MTPATTYTEDRHRYIWGDVTPTELTFDRFDEAGNGELWAFVEIHSELPPNPGLIHGPSRLNLTSERSVTMLVNKLTKRVPGFDWDGGLTKACNLTIRKWRDGSPLELLDPTADPARTWLLEPFVEADGATVLFAPGGTGKGYFALALALSVATGAPLLGVTPAYTGPVAYLDWEASKQETDRRISRLCRPLGIKNPAIYYRREQAALSTTAHTLALRLAEKSVVLAIVDSKGMAAVGSPESAESSIDLLRAVRRLRVPVLVIDHVSKAVLKGDDPDMAYGSVYTTNGARLAWSARASYKPGEMSLRLTNTKANNGSKSSPRGVSFVFSERDVNVTWQGETPRYDEMGGTVADRLAAVLADTRMSSTELGKEIGVGWETVRKTLARGPERFRRIGSADLWELSEPSLLPDPM